MIALLLTLACSRGPAAPEAAPEPIPYGDAECAVCGMVVGEQPAPRGQALHRDGTVVHFCSAGDLRAWLQTPSPHGEIKAAWSEVVPADFDPAAPAGPPLAWSRVEDAAWVVGFERAHVMGKPALSLATWEEAQQTAARLGGRPMRWSELSAVPFNEDPR